MSPNGVAMPQWLSYFIPFGAGFPILRENWANTILVVAPVSAVMKLIMCNGNALVFKWIWLTCELSVEMKDIKRKWIFIKESSYYDV